MFVEVATIEDPQPKFCGGPDPWTPTGSAPMTRGVAGRGSRGRTSPATTRVTYEVVINPVRKFLGMYGYRYPQLL